MQNVLYGLCAGLALALLVYIFMAFKLRRQKAETKAESEKYKKMLSDRMELESEGLDRLKKDNEELKKANENLRISLQSYAQKPGRKELQRLTVYQTAIDRLTINSPGFGPAWQAALKESEDEFSKTYIGIQPFIKKFIPSKTDATIIGDGDEN